MWVPDHPRRNYQLALIQRKEPQILVGCCGLRSLGCEAGDAELGIELIPEYWSRYGYAIEVAVALCEFGFGDLGLEGIYGGTVSANARIARLARWYGAVMAKTSADQPGCRIEVEPNRVADHAGSVGGCPSNTR